MEPPALPKTISEVLTRAASHPIYAKVVRGAGIDTTSGTSSLAKFPLLTKANYGVGISHMLASDPTALHSVHISPSGGTMSLTTVYDITPNVEVRRLHQLFTTNVVVPMRLLTDTDIVLNLQDGPPMYRGVSVEASIIEDAGATELHVSAAAPDSLAMQIAKQFGATVVTASSSRLLQFARYVKGVRGQGGEAVDIKKVIYTSETLQRHQEHYLIDALRAEVVGSTYGSTESGEWGAAPPIAPHGEAVLVNGAELDGEESASNTSRMFAFDRRLVVVEIISEDGTVLTASTDACLDSMDDRKPPVGEIVLTSLCKWRNPLVRYRTGDVGSLHPLSALGDVSKIFTHCSKPQLQELKQNLACICLYGRNSASFSSGGSYIDVAELDSRVFACPEWAVLDWQVILSTLTEEQQAEVRRETGNNEVTDMLEFRVVRKNGDEIRLEKEQYEEQLRQALHKKVFEHWVVVVVQVVEYNGLERGRLAGKVKKIVDRRA